MLRDLLHIRDTESEPFNSPGNENCLQLPATDHTEDGPGILQPLVNDPLSTYYFKANSDEMETFGIKKGNLLVVDRSMPATGGVIVIAWKNGEWLVRQLISHVKRRYLTTGKENDEPLEISPETKIIIWGVVTWCCCRQIEL
ncbi:hypothetical protein GZH53_05645 [Flavihumibacter sp. R14]|nr:hypothetical protein [Flavihumibacter soli]